MSGYQYDQSSTDQVLKEIYTCLRPPTSLLLRAGKCKLASALELKMKAMCGRQQSPHSWLQIAHCWTGHTSPYNNLEKTKRLKKKLKAFIEYLAVWPSL